MAVYYFTETSPGAPAFAAAAGGTITILDYCLVTGMGWTKTHSGTNLATYRAPTGNRFYIAFDDTAVASTRVRMYETVTTAGVAMAAGTNPTPLDSVIAGGLYFNKPSTGTGWFFASDGLIFYFGYVSTSGNPTMTFGDFISYAATDSYQTILKCHNSSTLSNDSFPNYATLGTSSSTTYIMKSFTQIGASIQGSFISDHGRSGGGTRFGSGPAYPNPISNTLDMAPIEITHPTNVIRGKMPGLWNPLHNYPLANGDTFTGSGNLSGRQFVARNVGGTGAELGQVFIETSDTWRT